MDFVPYQLPSNPVIAVVTIGLVVLWALVFLSGEFAKEEWKRRVRRGLARVLLVPAAVMVITMLVLMTAGLAAVTERRDVILEAFESEYGVTFSDRELELLQYPSDQPQGDSVVYGSVVHDGRGLFLVWDGSKMVLASSVDVGTFVPLPAQ